MLAERLGRSDPFFRRTTREHLAALVEGATGPTREVTLERLFAGETIKLPYPQTGPALTHFASEQMAADGLPALPEWRPDPTEPNGYGLRLLTAPGHHQSHTTFAFAERPRQLAGVARCLLHPDDAAARGLHDGDAIALYNDRGHVGLRLVVTADTRPGVVVVEGQRNRPAYLGGGPLNLLTDDTFADMGEGATYQSTWVEAMKLEEYGSGHAVDPS
jgi:anaerobic selenocysteine-containing dehydrogenase